LIFEEKKVGKVDVERQMNEVEKNDLERKNKSK